jgi:Mlc titration factor MtfA (ptsG expression regulator)
MTGLILAAIGLVLLLITGFVAGPVRRRRRRESLALEPFPAEWDRILRDRFQLDGCLPEEMRARLRKHIQVFVAEKNFEACGELEEVTDEMRVLIAAQACLLLIGLKRHDYFPLLKSILLYPGAFRDRGRRQFGLDDDDDPDRDIRLGESWQTGSVILSWKSVVRGAANDDDGTNVVIHEFAHQLDQADGSSDGAPILSDGREYRDWSEVLRRDYENLVEDANNPRSNPLLDPYGAENPAEFFAVASETFFEMPRDLEDEHPELYRELRDFYGLDPAKW